MGRLDAIGIPLLDDEEPARAECIRIARRLHHAGHQILGLLPTEREAAALPLAVQLGQALVELTGATVALVDANVRWPALPLLGPGKLAHPPDEDLYTTRWLHDSLALLIPTRATEQGAGALELRRLLTHARELFKHLLVDLTGFEPLGEHLEAAALVDRVVLVGSAGRTRGRRLRALEQLLPAGKLLGVILIG